MITGDNYYDTRVYRFDEDDAVVPPVVRALHTELCRTIKTHVGDVAPACERAWSVIKRWRSDGEPS